MTAPMSRREEVESVINCTDWCNGWEGEAKSMHHIARTLADEVDAERAVISKLLAMLEPGVAPPKSHVSCDCVECRRHKINEERYARACEIAGRVK